MTDVLALADDILAGRTPPGAAVQFGLDLTRRDLPPSAPPVESARPAVILPR